MFILDSEGFFDVFRVSVLLWWVVKVFFCVRFRWVEYFKLIESLKNEKKIGLER